MKTKKTQETPKKKSLRPKGKTRVHTIEEHVTHFDPDWTYDDLPDLAKRILQIEISNPGFSVMQIAKELNYTGDVHRLYDLRKLPLYQKLLRDTRKDEFTLLKEMQTNAIEKLRELMNSNDPRISLDVTKFILSHTREIALMKAKVELQKELNSLAALAEHRTTTVRFVMDGGVPIIGKTVMTKDGRIVPIDSDEGQEAMKIDYTEVKPIDEALKETLSASVQRPENSSSTHAVSVCDTEQDQEDSDDGIIGGIL